MKNVIRKESVIIKASIPKGTPIGANLKFNFQDNENLRQVNLWGIQTYYRGELKPQPPVNPLTFGMYNGILKQDLDYGLLLLDKAIFQRSFINLYDIHNDNFVINAPLVIFQTIQDNWSMGGTPLPPPQTNPDGDIVERDAKIFCGQHLDLQNCFISFVNSEVFTDVEFSIVIDFYYSRIDLDKLIKN
jgi:hypothetical protein